MSTYPTLLLQGFHIPDFVTSGWVVVRWPLGLLQSRGYDDLPSRPHYLSVRRLIDDSLVAHLLWSRCTLLVTEARSPVYVSPPI